MTSVIRLGLSLEELGSLLQRFDGSLSIDELTAKRLEVAHGATDQSVNFGGVETAKVMLVTSDRTITVKKNGSADAMTVNANGIAMFFNGSITALTVSNASGSTANITVILGG